MKVFWCAWLVLFLFLFLFVNDEKVAGAKNRRFRERVDMALVIVFGVGFGLVIGA